jgi:uncharacterized protein YndB with AHSA1/START domain
MKTLEFKIDIHANKQKVWDTMLQRETYEQWVSAGWPNSSYEGEWKQGEAMRFGSPGQGGTYAELREVTPYDYLLAEHTAAINPDGSLDRDSEMAKGWVGTTESYTFTEKNGKTELTVQMKTNPDWEEMFNEGWPAALEKLKELCEQK